MRTSVVVVMSICSCIISTFAPFQLSALHDQSDGRQHWQEWFQLEQLDAATG